MYRKFIAGAGAICVTLSLIVSSLADDLATRGRAILDANDKAVVTVQVVLKSSAGGGGPSESKQDLTGTVIDPSGLTVLALSACDPTELYQRVMSEDYSRANMQTEVTDVKILQDDGSETPAEIVLRDKDLDLAFIRPKTRPTNPVSAIDLAKSSKPQPLDQVLAIFRLNRAAGRACAGAAERVSAIIRKPQIFYIPESTVTSTSLGSPAFALDGTVVGIFVTRAISAKGGGSRNYRNSITGVILPAESVLKAAAQAPQPKPAGEQKEQK
jgi:S1-C subfamily serine protease